MNLVKRIGPLEILTGVVLAGLIGIGGCAANRLDYSENQRKTLKNEKCREIVFVERDKDLSGYLQKKDFMESDLINYVIEINNLKNSNPAPYGRNLFFPVYLEEKCKEIGAKKPKTYAETMGIK